MHLVSPVDAWLLLRAASTTEDLGRLKTAVGEVLGERNPALDLSIDNRWRAGLDGKTRMQVIRSSIARVVKADDGKKDTETAAK